MSEHGVVESSPNGDIVIAESDFEAQEYCSGCNCNCNGNVGFPWCLYANDGSIVCANCKPGYLDCYCTYTQPCYSPGYTCGPLDSGAGVCYEVSKNPTESPTLSPSSSATETTGIDWTSWLIMGLGIIVILLIVFCVVKCLIACCTACCCKKKPPSTPCAEPYGQVCEKETAIQVRREVFYHYHYWFSSYTYFFMYIYIIFTGISYPSFH